MVSLDSVLFLASPIEIGIVLMIALIVFGPKRLPEVGRQIGSALRELRRAANEVTRSFNTDYEPEGDSYRRSFNDPGDYRRHDTYYPPDQSLTSETVDLTDYTIAGAAPGAVQAADGDGEPDAVLADPTTPAAPPSVAQAGAPAAADSCLKESEHVV
ncbi:MAG: twin-arginine translocase TatA/TatE family subunit [Chthonomonadales bacterium]|nr:twin-arginine translocase TatA/TatE family subunit [Chthonomonadales bacterium]